MKPQYTEDLTLKIYNLYINIGRTLYTKPHPYGHLTVVQSSTTDEGAYTPAQSCDVSVNAENCQELSRLFAEASRKMLGIEP